MVTCDYRDRTIDPFGPRCHRAATHRYTRRSDSWLQQYACDVHADIVLASLRAAYGADDIVDEPRPTDDQIRLARIRAKHERSGGPDEQELADMGRSS
jgi:hypothetical protein